MSLAVLADHMASKGRGGDSMLIHMSPREVQGLQALAMAHGGSLTVNPDTGLPEALSLGKLLPAILGFAVTAATGIPAWQVGLGVGAVETARTGDLGRGITAGLGAYGGAGLGAGLSEAGATTLNNAAGQSYLSTAPGALADAGAGLSADMVANLENAGVSTSGTMSAAQQAAIDRAATATPFDKLSAGYDAAKVNPSSLLTKDNFKYLGAAAAPVLADQAVKSNLPTTTTRPGEVHTFSYNPYNQYYTPTGNYTVPVKSAASGGIMGFDESANSPMSRHNLDSMENTGGMFNYAHDGGGVMKMAEGGIAGYAPGGAIYDWFASGAGKDDAAIAAQMRAQNWTPAQVAEATGTMDQLADYENRFAAQNTKWNSALDAFTNETNPVNTAVTSTAATNNAAAAAPTYNQYTNEQIGKYLTDNPTADIAAATKTTNADPAAVNAYIASLDNPFVGSTADTRGSGTLGIYNQMKAQGISPDELYAASTAFDPKYAGWSKEDIARGYKLDESMYALSDAKKGNVSDTDWAKLMVGSGTWDKPQYSVNDMAQAAGLSTREVQARFDLEKAKANPVITCGAGFKLSADGKSCVPDIKGLVTCGAGYKLSADGKSCVLDTVVSTLNTVVSTKETDCPTGYHWDKTVNACVKNTSATQNTTDTVANPTDLYTAPANTLPVGIAGNTGPSQIGGGATINPNGTITTSPRIPGIPVGGFTGMENLRDVYTEGGGKLGFTSYAPKTIDEFNSKYKMTGGSKAAYDYLTGKTPYSPLPVTATGEVMKPYSESVLGVPMSSSSKQFLFDPATKKYTRNPDYIPVSYTSEGQKVYGLSSKDIAAQLPDVPKSDYEKWMKDNNVTLAQIAQSLGISLAEAKKRYPTAGSTDTTSGGKTSTEDTSYQIFAGGGLAALTMAGGGMSGQFDLGGYSDGGRLLRGPGDGVSDSIPATIGNKRPARLADGEFVVPARIVSELGNGSTEAGARKLYAMMDRVQAARKGSIGKGKVANNSRADKHLPA